MGYSTEFTGELKFTKEATAAQLAALKAMMGEDCRDHPEWSAPNLYYVDLQITDNFDGIEWNGAEKTYDLEKVVNVVIKVMREKWPDFGLVGSMLAQGENVDDRWSLTIGDDGLAHRVPIALSGPVITCPHCERKFALEQPA